MYAAKRSGSGVQAYRAEDGHSTARRLALAADLKVALRERCARAATTNRRQMPAPSR